MTAPGTKFGERERKLLTKLMRSVGSNFEHESTAARAAIDRLLKQFGRGWGDLVELLGGSPHFIHPDLVRELAALGSVDHASARTSINSTLDRHHQSWNGLVDELCSLTPALWVCVSWSGDADPEPAADLLEPVADLLELLVGTLKEFIEVKPAEYVTIALWVLHTHCFRTFTITPRLVLRSPVPGCGKSALMILLARLVARGNKFGSLSTAALLRLLDATRPTMLLDESDNLDFKHDKVLRAILNDGFELGACRALVIDGRTKLFDIYAPVALALPDSFGVLNRTLESRTITIGMERSARKLKRFDPNHSDGVLEKLHGLILVWLSTVKLDSDPPMPAGVLNRSADNWRAMISVADSLGHDCGALARRTMIDMTTGANRDADFKVDLLTGIRTLFGERMEDASRQDAFAADHFPGKMLLAALRVLDDTDWAEFRGVRGDEAPHPLRHSEMTSMLSAFGIRTRTLWPPGERKPGTSVRGYQRDQFEATWARYCAPVQPKQPDTASQATQPNNVRTLRPVGSGTK